MGTKCGDPIFVVLVGIHNRPHASAAPITNVIQVATRPSTRSALVMFTHSVLQLAAETSQFLTLGPSVRLHFVFPSVVICSDIWSSRSPVYVWS